MSRPMPLDQADGLRRLFAHQRRCVLPVVSNPNVAFAGVLLERLCTALGEHGKHVLVVDAGERASVHGEMALCDLAECIERLSPQVSYLAARGLPIRFVDATGSTASLLQRLHEAAPQCDVLLVHAPATDLCRLFARHAESGVVQPLLLADDRPASVTHAYAAMKLLVQRANVVVFDLLLGAARHSPRSGPIAAQLSRCADGFLGAVLRASVRVDPACDATDPPSTELRRLVAELLHAADGEAPAAPGPAYAMPAGFPMPASAARAVAALYDN